MRKVNIRTPVPHANRYNTAVKSNPDFLRFISTAAGLMLGAAACSSSTSSSSVAETCTSPPAVSRPMRYPPAVQGDRRTWGFIIANVSEQPDRYTAYEFGFTDPGGVEHLSSSVPATTLAQYPNRSPGTDRVQFLVGHQATVLTVYAIGSSGADACYTAPEIQFGANGNQDKTGPVEINPPPTPASGASPGIAAYQPTWSS